MNPDTDMFQDIEDSLAQGIAAVIAAGEELGQQEAEETHPEEMADLFLEELNRLWADPAPLALS